MMAPCVPGNAEPGVAASKRLATPCNTMHHRTQQAGWLVAWGLCECMLMCASMVWLLLSLFCNYTAGPLGGLGVSCFWEAGPGGSRGLAHDGGADNNECLPMLGDNGVGD